jgi:hypothetical protein
MLGPFQWGQGGRALTPEDVQRERALVALAQSRMGDTSPVAHWSQGATRVVDALGGVLREKRTNRAEDAGMASADDYVANDPVLSALIGGRAAPQGGPVSLAQAGGAVPSAAPTAAEALGNDAMAAIGQPSSGGYRESLIGTESGGNWAAQNSEMGAGGQAGHFGRVQFGQARLQDAMNAGAIPQGTTPQAFMASPELQMAAEDWHFADLESQLAPYVGAVVNGQPLDMGALVAMGHLGGAGGARRFVETGGQYNPSDSFGTSLADYAQTHGGYSGGGMDASGAPVPMQGGGAGVTAALSAAMSDPWVAEKYGPVLEALMGQEMQRSQMQYGAQLEQSDPLYQAQLAQQQFDLDQARNPGAPPPIEVGGVLLDPLTYEPIFDSRAGQAPDVPSAPETQKIYDPATGREQVVQWNGAEWVPLGGAAAGGSENGRYQPVGGQIWDMQPEGGGPPQLVGGGNEEVIYGPDGNPIVTRGPAGTSRPFTEAQSKDVGFATRARGALADFEPVANELTSRGQRMAESVPLGLGRGLQSDAFQTAYNSGREFLVAMLRKDTGAAITPQEETTYGEIYLPQPGDGEAVLDQKKAARQRAVAAIEAGMSPDAILAQERALATGQQSQQSPPTSPPIRLRYNQATGAFE